MEISASAEIAGPIDVVRAQTNDIAHHIDDEVHRSLNLNSLRSSDGVQEYYQEVRVLGLAMRDKVYHRTLADGSVCLTFSEGFIDGAELVIRLDELSECRTLVHQTFTVPLRGPKRLLAPLIRPLLKRALAQALEEDRADIEELGYPR